MSKKKSKQLFTSCDWDEKLLQTIWSKIEECGKELRLDYYKPRIELVNFEQMLEAYSSIGLPNVYSHWSFGKSFAEEADAYYKRGGGLAYELIINSNPTIAYCMESNTALLQTLVMAHAVCGHGSFFKNNYMFKNNTDADSILNFIEFSRTFISECEEKYGADNVEDLLTCCHTLQNYGIDIYKKKRHKSKKEQESVLEAKRQHLDSMDVSENKYFKGLTDSYLFNRDARLQIKESLAGELEEDFHYLNDENLLYVLEKHSPRLFPWEREIVRIVRQFAQYFYPQGLTKVMNEGWASFVHYHIMEKLQQKGHIDGGQFLEFLQAHCNVCCNEKKSKENPDGRFKYFNPYYLGFNIFMDIKRMCEEPTDEDKELYPDIVNTDWIDTTHNIMKNFKDEDFIRQYLTPNLMRKMNLVSYEFTHRKGSTKATCLDNCDEEGYTNIRNKVADSHMKFDRLPRLEVDSITLGVHEVKTINIKLFEGDRGQEINMDTAYIVRRYIRCLWGDGVKIVIFDNEGKPLKALNDEDEYID